MAELMTTNRRDIANHNTRKALHRNNGHCESCGNDAPEDSLVPVWRGDEIIAFACDNCMADHFITEE